MSSEQQIWTKLMQRTLDGDQQAYERLLTEISHALRGFLRKRISDLEAAEELLQEVLLGIHKARHTYDVSRPFSSWMYAIARYKLADHFRKQGRQAPTLSFDELENEALQMDVQGMESSNIDLNEIAQSLPEKQRLVFWDLKIDGLSIKQVAKKRAMSESAVKVNAHRAYKKVKAQIREQKQ